MRVHWLLLQVGMSVDNIHNTRIITNNNNNSRSRSNIINSISKTTHRVLGPIRMPMPIHHSSDLLITSLQRLRRFRTTNNSPRHSPNISNTSRTQLMDRITALPNTCRLALRAELLDQV